MSLNLTKGQTLPLKKADGSAVGKVRVGLAWNQADAGNTADLDLFIVRMSDKKVAYFGDRTALEGVELSADNRTGEGDGDDEFVVMEAAKSADTEYVIAINIYDAASKGQSLAQINGAKATVYNHETNEVLATFQITENGGANTGIIVGRVKDIGDSYEFKAVGDFVNGDINTITDSLS